jgi:hypothetical protein
MKRTMRIILKEIHEQKIIIDEYVIIKIINSLGLDFETYVIVLNEQARKNKKLSDLDELLKSLEEEELRMKSLEVIHALHGRGKWSRRAEEGNRGTSCPHCQKAGHTEEECWSLHPKLASEHLQEKFRKVLEAQKAKEPQARAASARIESVTAGVRRTVID